MSAVTAARDEERNNRFALRSNHNKATCALANKLARICYATLRDKERFDEQQPLTKKMSRQAFVMPV